MIIQYKQQELGNKTCGQACLSMITGETISNICTIMNKKGGTRNLDIIKVLKHFNIKYEYKRCSKFDKIPVNSIVKIGYKNYRNTHFIVKTSDGYYDPDFGIIKQYSDNIQAMSYFSLK